MLLILSGEEKRSELNSCALQNLRCEPLTEDPVKPQEDVPGTAIVIASSDYFRSFWIITILEMMFGFVHLGVLVSYLFQRLTR